MIPLQDHVRAFVEYFEHVGFVVLAAQTEQEALIRELHHELLQLSPNRWDCDAFDPIFANNPLPDRIVAIQNDHLKGPTCKDMNLSSQDRAKRSVEKSAYKGCVRAGPVAGRRRHRPDSCENHPGEPDKGWGSDPMRLRFLLQLLAYALRLAGSANATGEPGQNVTISGVDDRAIADRTALIKSAAFCTKIDSRILLAVCDLVKSLPVFESKQDNVDALAISS